MDTRRKKKIILNASEATHRAIKVVAAGKLRSINDVCLEVLENNPAIKKELAQ